MYPLVKCHECGTWWRAAEHRCPPPDDGGLGVRPRLPFGPGYPTPFTVGGEINPEAVAFGYSTTTRSGADNVVSLNMTTGMTR